nr:hypothetical protein K-LCC10_0226 [Kaumoebavirus]
MASYVIELFNALSVEDKRAIVSPAHLNVYRETPQKKIFWSHFTSLSNDDKVAVINYTLMRSKK